MKKQHHGEGFYTQRQSLTRRSFEVKKVPTPSAAGISQSKTVLREAIHSILRFIFLITENTACGCSPTTDSFVVSLPAGCRPYPGCTAPALIAG